MSLFVYCQFVNLLFVVNSSRRQKSDWITRWWSRVGFFVGNDNGNASIILPSKSQSQKLSPNQIWAEIIKKAIRDAGLRKKENVALYSSIFFQHQAPNCSDNSNFQCRTEWDSFNERKFSSNYQLRLRSTYFQFSLRSLAYLVSPSCLLLSQII